MAGRLFLFWGTLLVIFALCRETARGEGHYQPTRDGKTLVWNSDPKPGDVATWSGSRDRNDYAHGFGRLVWYTKEPGFDKPQLYARYWGRMVDGKLEGPVNVHSKRKTHYAIFIEGSRVTGWINGTAPSRATARWSMMVAKRSRANVEPASLGERPRGDQEAEPETPAAGPAEETAAAGDQRSDDTSQNAGKESISDLYDERWPKIDIDESLRILAFPPRTLRR